LHIETSASSPPTSAAASDTERLAYSIEESAELLGVDYFSVNRLIKRGKLRTCVPFAENCSFRERNYQAYSKAKSFEYQITLR